MKNPAYILGLLLIAFIIGCGKENTDIVIPNSKILFISWRDYNSNDFKLCSMNGNGAVQKVICDLTVTYPNVVISNTTKRIAFLRYNENGYWEIYVISIGGSNRTLIDTSRFSCSLPHWSSDDSKIVYSKTVNETAFGKVIFLYDFKKMKPTPLTQEGKYDLPAFSPNDKSISFCENNNIYLMGLDGANKRLLLTNAGSYKWSPKGDKIAFLSPGVIGSPQIFVANFDGSNPRQLTSTYEPDWDSGFPPFGNYNPQWTPDEKKIVYVSEAAHKFGNPEIFIMNSDGSNQKELTNTDKRSEDPVISPDGKYILFSSSRNNYTDVYVMGLNGYSQTNLTNYPGCNCLPMFIH